MVTDNYDEEDDVDDEKTEVKDTDSKSRTQCPFVKDGGWGWVVVLGSFFIHVIADGVVYSFGVLVPLFLDCFPDANRANVGGVGSVMIGVTWGSGPIASALVSRYGYKAVVVGGSAMASLGFAITIFAPNIWFMYFSFGILAGFGLGCTYLPAVVVISFYFKKNRSLATGIAASGAGIGTFVFAPFTQFLVNVYGWRGTVLIDAAMLLNCIACGLLFRPVENRKTKLFSIDKVEKAVSPKEQKTFDRDGISGNSESRITCLQFLDVNLIKDPIFIIFCLSNLLSSLAYCIPYIFLTDLSISFGIGSEESAFLISIIGITNTIARILFGFISDLKCVNRFFLYSTNLVICGLVSLAGVFFVVYPLLVFYATVFGVCMGVYTCLVPVVLIDLFGLNKISSGFGLVLLFQGIGAAVGPPIAGRLFDVSGNYGDSFYFMGATMSLGGAMLYFVSCYKRCGYCNRAQEILRQ